MDYMILKVYVHTTQSSLHHSFSKAPNERKIESNPLLLQPTHYDGLDDNEGSSRSYLSRSHIGNDTKVQIPYICIYTARGKVLLSHSIFYLKSLKVVETLLVLLQFLLWLLP